MSGLGQKWPWTYFSAWAPITNIHAFEGSVGQAIKTIYTTDHAKVSVKRAVSFGSVLFSLFLFQLWIIVAGTKLKLFNLLFQLAYPFLICFSFFRVYLLIIVVREVPSSFYILIYARMAWELGSNGLILKVFDEVQEVRYIAIERNGTLQLRLLTVSWKSLIQWWNFFLILHLLWIYFLSLNILQN